MVVSDKSYHSKSRVVLCRIRLLPIMFAKIERVGPGLPLNAVLNLILESFEFVISPGYRKYYFKRFIQCRIGCIKYFCKHFRQVCENQLKLLSGVATDKMSLESQFLHFSIDSLYFPSKVLLMKKPVVPKPIFPVGHRFSISGEYPHQYNQHIPQPGIAAILLHCHMFQLNKFYRGPTKGKSTSRT